MTSVNYYIKMVIYSRKVLLTKQVRLCFQ